MSDLSSYWHEKARAQIEAGRTRRAGLLATQSIRGGANRRVLERICRSGNIFFARADEEWVLSGANVHISFIGQDNGAEPDRELDGQRVGRINANLTTGLDLTHAKRLPENVGLAFYSDVKGGPFEITDDVARRLITSPNPDGRSNVDVVRPWANGLDLVGRPRRMWIVDFGTDMPINEAALYEAPFEYVLRTVKPRREASLTTQSRWWIHERPGHSMREAVASLSRYMVTLETAKYRTFSWLPARVLADHALVTIASEDDYLFGVLQSRTHELWALALGTQLETRPRYTPTTTFDTFPFPRPTDEQGERVGEAARHLSELRDGWLNPPDLDPTDLEKRTLTNLYNQRPTWLDHAHASLDAAVFAAYGWPADVPDTEILERLLALNLERAG